MAENFNFTLQPPRVVLAAKPDAWEELAVQSVFLLAVLATMAAVAVYLKRKFWSQSPEPPKSSELLSSFRDLHFQGELSDEEYRTIRTRLASRFQEEVNRPDQES